MPSKFSIKEYYKNCTYHIFNRGVNKQKIFWKKEDYELFIRLLIGYLGPYGKYHKRIDLLYFCLMPNHFHLVIEQKSKYDMPKFIHSLTLSYAKTINNKYARVGHLFQNRYKARVIAEDHDFVQLSAYVHRNPIELGRNPFEYKYSSISDYVPSSETRNIFVNNKRLLEFFGDSKRSYRKFLLEQV